MTVYIDTTAAVDNAIITRVSPPKSVGCVGLFEAGGASGTDEGVVLRNLVNPDLPFTKVGSPTFGAVGVLCSSTAHLSLATPDTAVWSRIVIAEATAFVASPSSGSVGLVGNANGTNGAGLFLTAAAGAPNMIGIVGGGQRTLAPAADHNLYAAFGQRLGANHKVANYTAAQSTEGSQSAYTPQARPILLGWTGHSGFAGPSRIIAALFYNIAITDTEEAAAVAWLVARAVARTGITMGA